MNVISGYFLLINKPRPERSLEGGVGPGLGGGDEPLCVLPRSLARPSGRPRLSVGAGHHPLHTLYHPESRHRLDPVAHLSLGAVVTGEGDSLQFGAIDDALIMQAPPALSEGVPHAHADLRVAEEVPLRRDTEVGGDKGPTRLEFPGACCHDGTPVPCCLGFVSYQMLSLFVTSKGHAGVMSHQ